MHRACLLLRLGLIGLVNAGTDSVPANGAPETANSPEGLWATFDDRSGARRSLIRMAVEDGHLSGTIIRIYRRPDEASDPTCTRCEGPRRGARVVGMVIVWGHRARGSRWSDGRILDPENGKEYASSVWLEGPATLRVRGRWGPFYRTQTWRRALEDAVPDDVVEKENRN